MKLARITPSKSLTVLLFLILVAGFIFTLKNAKFSADETPYTASPKVASNIAAGQNHSLMINSDGTVSAWGLNTAGKLGDGTTTTRFTPVLVNGLTDVVSLSAGINHSLALKSDGTVWAWGQNYYGQLGNGSTTDQKTPVQVQGISEISSIAAFGYQSFAMTADGYVYSWGMNTFGQLGLGNTVSQKTPTLIPNLDSVQALGGGQFFSFAIKSDGSLWAWGQNNYGQLGDGTKTNRTSPVNISGVSNLVAISGGQNHTLALTKEGLIWTWGSNEYGQLGYGNSGVTSPLNSKPLPAKLSGISQIQSISSGGNFNLALKANGSVYSWGQNNLGQLGTNSASGVVVTPQTIPNLNNILEIATGQLHALALQGSSDGTNTLYAWGSNSVGQLGTTAISSNSNMSKSPIPVNTGISAKIYCKNNSAWLKTKINDMLKYPPEDDVSKRFTIDQQNFVWDKAKKGQGGLTFVLGPDTDTYLYLYTTDKSTMSQQELDRLQHLMNNDVKVAISPAFQPLAIYTGTRRDQLYAERTTGGGWTPQINTWGRDIEGVAEYFDNLTMKSGDTIVAFGNGYKLKATVNLFHHYYPPGSNVGQVRPLTNYFIDRTLIILYSSCKNATGGLLNNKAFMRTTAVFPFFRVDYKLLDNNGAVVYSDSFDRALAEDFRTDAEWLFEY